MTTTEALQAALAAEHATIFVYGALGARTSESGQPGLYAAVTEAYRVHQQRRSRLVAMLRELGVEPVAAEPGYRLPEDLSTAAAVRRRALRLERSCAAAYAYLVGNAVAETRRFGLEALLDAALRELQFGGKPRPLPGL